MSELIVDLSKPFIEGTLHTIKVSCDLASTVRKPFVKGTATQPSFDIASVIAVAGKGFTATVTLCFPEKPYLALMSTMLGESLEQITADTQDGAAELLNMVFGHAKIALNNQGLAIQLAIPTVMRGKDLVTSHPGKRSVVVIPFDTKAGEFHLEICVDSQKS